jgi:hypothetical protein
MARWHRDPKVWRRVMFLIAVVDVLAIAGNFFFIFRHYLWWTCLNVITSWHEPTVLLVVSYVLTGLVFVVLIYQAWAYSGGQVWARRAFLAENLVGILAGLLWFLVNLGNPAQMLTVPLVHGLLVPMITLFPLLWPLWVFRPMKPPEVG